MSSVRAMPPLLEREREVSSLEDVWRSARRGRGSTWLICAEAGGGKTRLMREFARTAGAPVRWGAAEPVSPPEPYQAVRTALPDVVPAATRAETVNRVVEHLTAAGDAPVLCVLDDLHFADEGTIAVLVRLARESRERPWLVLAAFRPEEGPAPLRIASVELEAQAVASRLDLPPLSRGAVGTLVAHAGGTQAVADAIFVDSGGNPWLAEALARGGASVGAARNRIVLKLDRLEAANPGAFALLVALAPATSPLPHALVADLTGGDSRALRRTLAQLRDAGMLVEGDGGWQFRHEILRRSLLETLIGAEWRDAHRLLAEALQRHEGGAAELAMHFAEAGDQRAVDWAIRAAQAARAVDAHAEALAQLERALTFDLPDEVRRATLEATALELHDLGRFVEERRRAEEALAIPDGEPEGRARLHQFAARAASASSDSAGDEAHLAAAEAALAGRPVSRQMVNIACARVARAAVYYAPRDLPARAERARRFAAELGIRSSSRQRRPR